MAERFAYLLDRIEAAEFEDDPFPHLLLTDFLADEDFQAVIAAREIAFPACSDIHELFGHLDDARYERTDFPGCVRSKDEYLRWLEKGLEQDGTNPNCEAQGLAFRLTEPQDETVAALDAFFRTDQLRDLLVDKFAIDRPVRLEGGVQKYLHGYEISPHPDIRKKALTWMLNVNPGADAEQQPIHTHYMRFKPEWSYIPELWRHNPSVETCWVPWDWCTTVTRQPLNNSIVLFSPRWDTLHGVRTHYDHLAAQRTQLYGNLWYDPIPEITAKPAHDDLSFTPTGRVAAVRDLTARLEEAEAQATELTDRLERIESHPAVRLARRVRSRTGKGRRPAP